MAWDPEEDALLALERIREDIQNPIRHDPILIGADLDTIERVIRDLAAAKRAAKKEQAALPLGSRT